MPSPNAPGWYGKLSSLGDFASRRLAADDVQWLDDWLSASVRTSQQQLGERWMEVYLSAPLWRFVLGPGVMGPQSWCGVMMPSCDNVGRYFPLLVMRSCATLALHADGLADLDRWWLHVGEAAQRTLLEGATPEAFEAALGAAPVLPEGVPGPAIEPERAWRQSPASQATSLDLLLALTAGGIQRRLQGHSLWWAVANVAADGPGATVILPGLPPPAAFATLLQGRW